MIEQKLIDLICRAQRDEKDAVELLFNEIYNDVYYFALKTVKDSFLAADITQEALIDIFNNLKSLKDPVAFPAWSRQITYHRCTAHFRKKQDVLVEENEDGATVFDTLEEEGVEFIPEEALDQKDFRSTILEFIDTLSEEQRSAVMMYYFDELSISAIAEIQGVSEGTVKSRLNYARKTIKEQVEAYEKKHGIKLHSVIFFPFMHWLFSPDKAATTMPAAAAESAAAAVGTTVTASATAGTGAAVGGGIIAKIVALPVVTKIVAVIAAAVIVAGSATTAVVLSDNKGGKTSVNADISVSSGIVEKPIYAGAMEGEHRIVKYDIRRVYSALPLQVIEERPVILNGEKLPMEQYFSIDVGSFNNGEYSIYRRSVIPQGCECFMPPEYNFTVKDDYTLVCSCGKTQIPGIYAVQEERYAIVNGERKNETRTDLMQINNEKYRKNFS